VANDWLFPIKLPTEQQNIPPIEELAAYLVPFDHELDVNERLVLFAHPGVHEQILHVLSYTTLPLRLCPSRCWHRTCQCTILTLCAIPCAALLWRHRSLEQRLQNLEERHLRLQYQVGRIIETLGSWDDTVATMFGLTTPPLTNPTGV